MGRRRPRNGSAGGPPRVQGLSAHSRLPHSAWHAPSLPAAGQEGPARRTGRKPKYAQYEGFRPARREHAPAAAGPRQECADRPYGACTPYSSTPDSAYP
ncbi:hypothetical protein EDD38_0445 [Kitasatospora cineracea]|uniref:Uncharacterized protein n=1 Tax=Kitasatospora cineracea TaxID=88074 RepID=A0A3N4RM24_9ACTN|nr:hypothetical protein EDD39_6657 [Kitasatospora cineracea]RPE32199.1 hypothetical protein EDD38_0445 [Kitasatospora cineracea]